MMGVRFAFRGGLKSFQAEEAAHLSGIAHNSGHRIGSCSRGLARLSCDLLKFSIDNCV